MTSLNTAMDVIQLLKNIEQRNQQGGTRLSQQSERQGGWTAIDFRIAQLNYLIPLTETREIFPVPQQITEVPRSKAWVYGIANLRGELLPIFDLKCFLLGQTSKVNKRSRILVINHPDIYSGLLVDEVFGLKHFQSQPQQTPQQKDSPIAAYLNGNIAQNEANWDVFSFQKLASDQRFLNAAK
jgi:twitching motility protein PilI